MKKSEILASLEGERERFLDELEGLNEADLEIPGVLGEWSVKDILVHLSRWEAELVKLLFQAHNGQKPSSAHFTQQNVDDTNQQWFEEGRTRPIQRVLDDFHAVRNQTILRVEEFSERDLTDSKRYSWAKQIPLAEWIASDSFEHEAEHRQHIAAWRFTRKS